MLKYSGCYRSRSQWPHVSDPWRRNCRGEGAEGSVHRSHLFVGRVGVIDHVVETPYTSCIMRNAHTISFGQRFATWYLKRPRRDEGPIPSYISTSGSM